MKNLTKTILFLFIFSLSPSSYCETDEDAVYGDPNYNADGDIISAGLGLSGTMIGKKEYLKFFKDRVKSIDLYCTSKSEVLKQMYGETLSRSEELAVCKKLKKLSRKNLADQIKIVRQYNQFVCPRTWKRGTGIDKSNQNVFIDNCISVPRKLSTKEQNIMIANTAAMISKTDFFNNLLNDFDDSKYNKGALGQIQSKIIYNKFTRINVIESEIGKAEAGINIEDEFSNDFIVISKSVSSEN